MPETVLGVRHKRQRDIIPALKESNKCESTLQNIAIFVLILLVLFFIFNDYCTLSQQRAPATLFMILEITQKGNNVL